MSTAFLSSRREVLRFIGDIFHVLEVVAEELFAASTEHRFQWSCVRVLDTYELQGLHLTGPIIELRPAASHERYLVLRHHQELRIFLRSEFFRAVSDSVIAMPDVLRLGAVFVPFEKALRQSLDLLGIERGSNVRLYHREFPDWTQLSTEESFAVRNLGEAAAQGYKINPPACLLLPENEIRQWKKYLLTRRWSRNQVGRKRWVLEVRAIPIAHRILLV